MIGAIYANPFGRTLAGVSYLILGTSINCTNIDLNLTSTQVIKIYGAKSSDKSGISVSGVGDTDNDGYDDIIVGAYDATPLARSGAGESYLIFGSSFTNAQTNLPTDAPTMLPTVPTTDPTMLPTKSPTGTTEEPTMEPTMYMPPHSGASNTQADWFVPTIATLSSIAGIALVGTLGWCIYKHYHSYGKDTQVEMADTIVN